jgi:hypothetical protein
MKTAEEKKSLLKHTYFKNILSALAVAVIGFVLLNLTFLLYYLVFRLFDIFIRSNPEAVPQWIQIARTIIFLVIIALISWAVFRSKLPVLVKAIYMTVPTAVVLVIIGILLYPWPFLPYLIGGILTAGVLLYFYRAKKPWLYYYSVILVALTLMIFTLTGGEI